MSAASWMGSIAPVIAADSPENAQGIAALPWSFDPSWCGVSPCMSGMSIVAGAVPEHKVMAMRP